MHVNFKLIFFPLLFLFLLLTTGISGAEDNNISFVSHIGGGIYTVAVAGNYAYVGEGQDLVILDITNTSNPKKVAKLTTQSLVTDIAISDGYVYAVIFNGDGSNSLLVVDISDPLSPKVAGSYNLADDYALSVTVSGNYVYLGRYYDMTILDISNPSAPKFVGSYSFNSQPHCTASEVAISGNYAYVNFGSYGLRIVDISNPTSPTFIGVFNVSNPYHFNIVGNRTYVTCESEGLVIFDTSNPLLPTRMGKYNPADARPTGIAVSGNYAYIANANSGDNGLIIIDVTNSSSPSAVGKCNTGYSTYVTLSGSQVYLINSQTGLAIVDVTNVFSPKLLSSYNSIDGARDVAVFSNYAYVADYCSGLSVINITDPSSPEFISSCNIDGYTTSIKISGRYAYVGNSLIGKDGLNIIDISDPFSPNIVSSCADAAGDIAVSSNYAYLAAGDNGLEIVDISNPFSPRLISSLGGPLGAVSKIAVESNFAYLASDSGLIIIDITDPSLPKLIGSYSTGNFVYDFSVYGNYVYIAKNGGGSKGLLIVDTTDKSSPKLVGDLSSIFAAGVDIRGKYAYISSYTDGLNIADLTNTAQPTIVGHYNTAGTAFNSYAKDSNVYVADEQNGLVILRTDIPSQTQIKVGQNASTPEIEQCFKDAYNRNGGLNVLGNPTTEVHEEFGFQTQDFPGVSGIPGGAIMYNPNNNTSYYIHGAIWQKYYYYPDKAKLGSVASDEGVAAIQPEKTTGNYTKFETGTIHWISDKNNENLYHPQRGQSFVTYGDLDKVYTDLGGTYSDLGFPLMDQKDDGNGHDICEFEGGNISWDDSTGTYKVKLNSEATSLTIEDLSPKEGDSFKNNRSITFKVSIKGGRSPYTYTWKFDEDEYGNYGSHVDIKNNTYAGFQSDILSLGQHTVKLQVSDSQGHKAESNRIHFKVYTKKVAVVPAKFSDSKKIITDPSFVSMEKRCNLVQQYYSSQSYGTEYIVFEYYKNENNVEQDGWFKLNNSSSDFNIAFIEYYGNESNITRKNKWHSFWQYGCDAAGIQESYGYDTIMVLFDVTGIRNYILSYTGEEKKDFGEGKKVMVMCNASNGYGTYSHELGHALYGFRDKYPEAKEKEGEIGPWGLMGDGNTVNPPAPIIGFEKTKKGWLPPYSEIRESNIGSSGEEYTVSYLDEQEPLLCLLEDYPLLAGVSKTKYYLFEGRRIKDGTADGIAAESLTNENHDYRKDKLFYRYNKGIVIYNIDNKDMIWRETSDWEFTTKNDEITNYEVTIYPGKSKFLSLGQFKATCLSAGDEGAKLKIEPAFLVNMVSIKIDTINYLHSLGLFSSNNSNLDMDLHVITDDGRRIGVDDINNVYYNEIEGALTSGDLLGGGPEWITVPQNVKVTAYVTISSDLKALLASNSSASVEVNTTRIVFDENGNATQSEPITIKINSTNLKDQYQLPLIDTPPSSITNLQFTNDTIWLKWTWTNPKDADFNHTEIYLNGVFQTNTSAEYFNATELQSETNYTLSTRTVDNSRNINETWVNSTAKTKPDTIPPIIESVFLLPVNATAGSTINISANITDNIGVVEVKAGDIQLTKIEGVWQGNITAPSLVGNYSLWIIAKDDAGNTAETTAPYNVIPPQSISNIRSSSGMTWLNFTWTSPQDDVFNHTEIYLDGIFQTNTFAEYFNATGLEPDTNYTIGTHTADIYGNVNETWVNFTAKTDPDTISPVIESAVIFPVNTTAGSKIKVTVNATDNIRVVNVTAGSVYLANSNGLWQGNIIAPSSRGKYSLLVNASDAAGNTVNTSVPYSVVRRQGSFNLGILPRLSSVGAGKNYSIIIKVKNAQNIDESFNISINTNGLSASQRANMSWFNLTEKTVDLKAKQEISIPVKVSVPAGTTTGLKAFKVNVNSETSKIRKYTTGYLYISRLRNVRR